MCRWPEFEFSGPWVEDSQEVGIGGHGGFDRFLFSLVLIRPILTLWVLLGPTAVFLYLLGPTLIPWVLLGPTAVLLYLLGPTLILWVLLGPTAVLLYYNSSLGPILTLWVLLGPTAVFLCI